MRPSLDEIRKEISESKREYALSKHTIRFAKNHPMSKSSIVNLDDLEKEVHSPYLKKIVQHLLDVLKRVQNEDIDTMTASIEIKINQQILKTIALDHIKRVQA